MGRTLSKWLVALIAIAASGAQAAEPAAPVPAAAHSEAPALAPARPADAPQALPSPVLAYIPEDADLAVFVRMDQLVRSNLWKSFAAPQVGYYQKLTEKVALRLDLERDVVAAAFVLEIAWKDGKPLFVSHALILETKRDVQAGDLLTGLFKARPARTGAVMYPVGSGPSMLALPTPRVAVLASGEGEEGSGEFLTRLLETGRKHQHLASEPLPVAALAAPGEVTFAARASSGLKEGVLAHYQAVHRGTLRPHMDGGQAMQFGLYYNLVRLVIQAETVAGSLDLARQGDALRADIRFEAPQMAPFMVAVLQAMADPLQMCLPAVVGGEPLGEPPAEPFYRAVAEGPTVHLAMPRVAVERLADRLVAAARQQAAADAGAANLRKINEAVAAYVAAKGSWPQTWSALTKAGFLRDPAVFENPARAEHRVTGDYELVPLTKAAAGRRPDLKVLAYEICPLDPPPRGLNVLFADGTVQYIEYDVFQQLYRQTLESLGR
ncbi:MAG: hypothetical protein NTX87_11975 [Planctomycetota bacterium]|nr:hypothetical protein [Planctomycetota bacterium]